MSLLAINLDGGQTDAGLSMLPVGALFTGSGILRPTAFTASEQSPLARAIDISGSQADDIAIIKTADGSTYAVKNTATVPVSIAANLSGVTKTDAIVLYVDLSDGDPDNAGSPGAAHIIAVRRSGVSTGNPTNGEIDAATLNNPWLLLHRVTVENGAAEIEDTDLTDVRLACWFHTQFYGMDNIPGSALVNSGVTTPQIKPTTGYSKGNGSGSHATTSTSFTDLTTVLSYTAGATNERLFVDVTGVFNVSANAAIIRLVASGTGVVGQLLGHDRTSATLATPFALQAVIDVPAGSTLTLKVQGKVLTSGTLTLFNAAESDGLIWYEKHVAYGNT